MEHKAQDELPRTQRLLCALYDQYNFKFVHSMPFNKDKKEEANAGWYSLPFLMVTI